MKEERIITVFGSSRPRESDAEYEEAGELGRMLATSGFSVCSGGFGGGIGRVAVGWEGGGGEKFREAGVGFCARGQRWSVCGRGVARWERALVVLLLRL